MLRRLALLLPCLAGCAGHAQSHAHAAPPTANEKGGYVIERPDLIAEGIAFDPRTRRLFLGSEYRGEIVVVASEHDEPRTFASGLLAVLGLRVDERRGRLWAATNGEPGTQTDLAARGRSELVALDLATGAVVARLRVPTPGKHLLNDVAVAENGTAYVTDSEDGSVWRASPDATTAVLEPFVSAATLRYPNGIAFAAARLYVADGSGLSLVDDHGQVRALSAADGVEPRGIDGMYACGAGLVAVQNGRRPYGITRFDLDSAGERLVAARVVELGSLESPTTAALDGSALLAVANSDTEALGERGLAPGARPRTIVARFDGVCPDLSTWARARDAVRAAAKVHDDVAYRAALARAYELSGSVEILEELAHVDERVGNRDAAATESTALGRMGQGAREPSRTHMRSPRFRTTT